MVDGERSRFWVKSARDDLGPQCNSATSAKRSSRPAWRRLGRFGLLTEDWRVSSGTAVSLANCLQLPGCEPIARAQLPGTSASSQRKSTLPLSLCQGLVLKKCCPKVGVLVETSPNIGPWSRGCHVSYVPEFCANEARGLGQGLARRRLAGREPRVPGASRFAWPQRSASVSWLQPNARRWRPSRVVRPDGLASGRGQAPNRPGRLVMGSVLCCAGDDVYAARALASSGNEVPGCSIR